MFKPCALIPVYNHPDTIGRTVAEVRAHMLPVILVDDGCDSHCGSVLARLAEQDDQVHVLQLPHNLGKGGAVKAGLYYARAFGYTHALQIDADGQHDTNDIPRLLDRAREHPEALISGRPDFDESVPRLRYYCRYLTHGLVWLHTLSFAISDSMCGFRVYPLAAACRLVTANRLGDRMDFDPEIIVRWYWDGGKISQFPTRVRYPEDGVSHFRGWEDNWLITRMHVRLFFGMLVRLPGLLGRRMHLTKRSRYEH